MQNLVIIVIVALCAFFIGRRLYRTLGRPRQGCGCDCSCTGCDPKLVSICRPDKKSETPR